MTNAGHVHFVDGEGQREINGVRHWYRIVANDHRSAPIVVVHGGPGGNQYVFERTIGPYLESFATLVYYEQRGSGRSESPADPDDYAMPTLVADLEALRQQLGIDRMVLLGFSFGCELALEYTLQHPGHVESLILQCPSVAAPTRVGSVQMHGLESVATGDVAIRMRTVIDESIPLEEKHERIWEIVDSETVDRLLFVDPAHAARNRRMWESSGLVNSGAMARALAKQARGGEPLYRRLTDVQQPTLVLVGLHDRNVGVDVARDVADALPDATMVIFENSAHFPDIEESEKYARTVDTFLQRIRSGLA